MVVKNVPGGGSIIGLEQIYAAKPDGLTLGFTHAGGLVSRSLFHEPRPKFDADKFNWLGYMAQEPIFLVISGKAPYQTLKDLQKAKNLKCPSLGVVDTWAISSGLVCELLGIDAQIIPGFNSGTDVMLAVTRGEVDFSVLCPSYFRGVLKKGTYKGPLVVLQRERSPLFPDVPAITELVTLTPEQDKYFDLALAMFTGRVLIAPPGMDKAMVDFLRAKTKEIFANKGYLRQANRRWKDWVDPWDGEKMQQAVEKVTSIDRAEASALVEKMVRSRLAAQ